MDLRPQTTWSAALEALNARAECVDQSPDWPAENLEALRRAGAMAWAVTVGTARQERSEEEIQEAVLEVGAACLTTALVWTQRDAAVGLLRGVERTAFVQSLLDGLRDGEIWATIGIAQLTTSRQHGLAAVRAARVAGGWMIDGAVPWATGADAADWLVIGAREGTGQQLLLAVERRAAGVRVGEPMALAALRASRTAAVLLERVVVPDAQVLSGPVADALAGRRNERSFALPTCILPLGVAQGAIAAALTAAREDEAIRVLLAPLVERQRRLKAEVFTVGLGGDASVVAACGAALRAAANRLAMDAALAALQLAKGRGYMADHAAQRRAREAMFFYVWSSPRNVLLASLESLTSGGE